MPVTEVHTKEDYKSLIAQANGNLVIVDFSATWCGPCRRISGLYHQLSEKFRTCTFLSVDADECFDIVGEEKVTVFPTFIFIKDDIECHRILGANADDLSKTIADLSSLPPGEIERRFMERQ